MRVAILSPTFWPEVRRGTERFARELADGLRARGHRPRLVTSHPGRPSQGVEDGLPVTRVWRPPAKLVERRLGVLPHLSHVPFSYLSLLGGEDDVAHALYASDAQAAARWSAKTGRPSVYTHMGIPDRADLTWRRGSLLLVRRAIERCSAVTVLSRVAADELRRSLGVEARVINPGVDLEAFSPRGERAERPTLFCAADLTSARKRVPLLVEAFRILRADQPEARLVLSRPGDRGAAERFARANPEVELVDVDDRLALARAYSEAWVTALPSVGEAFGLVLAESLACGTPVVATDDGGMREVVDRPEVGRLLAGDQAEDLAAALHETLELARDPATAAACRRRSADFSIDLCTERFVALYRELLG